MENSKTKESHVAWHNISSGSVLSRLETSTAGLSANEANARLTRYGTNRLPEAARRSALLRFLFQFHNILIYVLIGAAAITAFWGTGSIRG
ncbi:cation-transporting P-type ATPase [Oxalobacteraceae bacterium R-40]|uniref:Cation-transporting P-type ATPase n=1 Tax=Keguizhuia sedimenti TaxID=3064264 RepID=A0ABU1BPC6_9BURK|nr:cation-transporting P-type ATPase [Oxalobacteraceae bacterium R-40]